MPVQNEYKTIGGSAEASFTERKSDFTGYIRHVETDAEAVAFVAEIRALHRKATHNCYAYILRDNNIVRHSDDGEPSGTAGVPICELLRKEGLTDVACVVTRYFGGILLGAGGLVRAYTQGAKIAVDAAQKLYMCTAVRLTITLEYTLYGRIGKALAEADVRTENEEFADNVTITVIVRENDCKPLCDRLTDLCNGAVRLEESERLWYDFGGK